MIYLVLCLIYIPLILYGISKSIRNWMTLTALAAIAIWIYFILRAARIARDYGNRENYETWKLMEKEIKERDKARKTTKS